MTDNKSQSAAVLPHSAVIKIQPHRGRLPKSCKSHPGESPFMTPERHACRVCGKVYYYDRQPWDPAQINKPEVTRK